MPPSAHKVVIAAESLDSTKSASYNWKSYFTEDVSEIVPGKQKTVPYI